MPPKRPTRYERHQLELCGGALQLQLWAQPDAGRVAYRVWPCAEFLIATLCQWRGDGNTTALTVEELECCCAHKEKSQQNLSQRRAPLRVLELGSGTGVVGLALKALQLAETCLLTDQLKCMDILSANCGCNPTTDLSQQDDFVQQGASYVDLCTSSMAPIPISDVRCMPLNWKDGLQPSFEMHNKHANNDSSNHPTNHVLLEDFNTMVVCECIYDTYHITNSPLIPLIEEFLTHTSSSETAAADAGSSSSQLQQQQRIVIIAYETRDADVENAFFDQLRSKLESLSMPPATTAAVATGQPPSEGNESGCEFCEYRVVVARSK